MEPLESNLVYLLVEEYCENFFILSIFEVKRNKTLKKIVKCAIFQTHFR